MWLAKLYSQFLRQKETLGREGYFNLAKQCLRVYTIPQNSPCSVKNKQDKWELIYKQDSVFVRADVSTVSFRDGGCISSLFPRPRTVLDI